MITIREQAWDSRESVDAKNAAKRLKGEGFQVQVIPGYFGNERLPTFFTNTREEREATERARSER